MLRPSEAKAYYDRFGSRQDDQGFYEDLPITALIDNLDTGSATSVVELGCGTGRLALRLLEEHLPGDALYSGIDISDTMVGLTRDRLAEFNDRARVVQGNGVEALPCEVGGCDRVIAAYVLDLLSEDDIKAFLVAAHAALNPGGLIGIVGLTRGEQGISRVISALWQTVHRLWPTRVGGCRPLEIRAFFEPDRWRIEVRRVVVQSAIPSEILVATRL